MGRLTSSQNCRYGKTNLEPPAVAEQPRQPEGQCGGRHLQDTITNVLPCIAFKLLLGEK